jgi:Flp pilus assembly protein TadG
MVMMAVCMVMLLGAFGLAFDIGRALITKNEAQAFTDSASLAATIHLNGTNAGIDNAKNAVAQTSNRWMMGTKKFTSVVTEFSPDKVTWETNPVNVVNTKYVRVTAPANFVTMHMLTAVGVPQTLNAPARSVAGFQLPTTFPQGVFPFAPLAKANTKPNFG